MLLPILTSNFFVFIQFIVNYVAWPVSNSASLTGPGHAVPMYFCNIIPNLNKVESLKFHLNKAESWIASVHNIDEATQKRSILYK